MNASQGGWDDVLGNKGDDTLDVRDREGNDFVNYGESGEDRSFGDRPRRQVHQLRRQRLPGR